MKQLYRVLCARCGCTADYVAETLLPSEDAVQLKVRCHGQTQVGRLDSLVLADRVPGVSPLTVVAFGTANEVTLGGVITTDGDEDAA